MNEEMSNNIAGVTGRVAGDPVFSHEVYGEGFYSFELEVSRLSHVSDFLPKPTLASSTSIFLTNSIIGKCSLFISSFRVMLVSALVPIISFGNLITTV